MNEEQQLVADFEAQKKDFAFFDKGVPFSEVRVCSAKALLGGKWRDVVKQYLGEETLQLFAERSNGDGGKTIDFPLAAFDVGDKTGLFSKGEKISIVCGNNKYNGSYEVLATEDKFVIILKGMDGNAAGTIINQSRKNGARKAMEKTKNRLSKLEGNGAQDVKKNEKEKKESKPGRYKYGWLLLVATLILIFIFSKRNN